ncbi:MAG: hypothetical protein AAGI53_01695 [Planctomycetota bacterium]
MRNAARDGDPSVRASLVEGQLRQACAGGGVGVAVFEHKGAREVIGVDNTGAMTPSTRRHAFARALVELRRMARDAGESIDSIERTAASIESLAGSTESDGGRR